MKKTIIFFFFFQYSLLSGFLSHAFSQTTTTQQEQVKFRFKFNLNDIFIVEKFQFVTMEANQTKIERQEKNRIVLKAVIVNDQGVVWKGKFITYERYPKIENGFRLLNEFNADFTMHWDGKFIIDDKYIMPNIRSIPSFPAETIRSEYNWTKPAEQYLLLNGKKYFLPLNVRYLYRGKEKLPAEALAHPLLADKQNVLSHQINYTYEKNQFYMNTPVKNIASASMSTIWFDADNGIPYYSFEKIAYQFTFTDTNPLIYIFKVHSWYKKEIPATTKEKTDLVAEIKTTIQNNQEKNNPIPDKITVQKTPEGVKLTLNDILFAPDSAVLNVNAKRQLLTIAQFLQKHPDREVRVLGHTDNRGGIGYNQKLSEARAQSVLVELKKAGVHANQLSYKGYGQSKPVAENNTPAGRAKNRRVEIDLLVD